MAIANCRAVIVALTDSPLSARLGGVGPGLVGDRPVLAAHDAVPTSRFSRFAADRTVRTLRTRGLRPQTLRNRAWLVQMLVRVALGTDPRLHSAGASRIPHLSHSASRPPTDSSTSWKPADYAEYRSTKSSGSTRATEPTPHSPELRIAPVPRTGYGFRCCRLRSASHAALRRHPLDAVWLLCGAVRHAIARPGRLRCGWRPHSGSVIATVTLSYCKCRCLHEQC